MSNHLQSDDASSDGVKPSASISAEFSSDVIERADEMLAFDEAYPISLLQRHCEGLSEILCARRS